MFVLKLSFFIFGEKKNILYYTDNKDSAINYNN